MVRNYKRKHPVLDKENMQAAVGEVLNGRGLRETADHYNVKHTTLFYRVKNERLKNNLLESEESVKDYSQFSSLQSTHQVFTTVEEEMLVKYILKCSKIHYGLTYSQIRVLAYEYAKKLDKRICQARWDTHKQAGIEWLKGFMKRNSTLSLRKPENTSLSRASSFTKVSQCLIPSYSILIL